MKNISLILLLAITLSCKNTKQTTQSTPVSYPIAIVFDEITQGDNGGFMSKKNSIINTPEEFDEVWNEAFSNFMNKPPLPKINFETKLVLLIAMGEKTNGGYSIQVASVTENENDVTVIIQETIPGPTCMTTSAMTYPFQLIEIPATSKKIIFNTIEKIYSCEE